MSLSMMEHQRHHHEMLDHLLPPADDNEKPHFELPAVAVTDASKEPLDPVEAKAFRELNKVDARDAAVPTAEIVHPEPNQNAKAEEETEQTHNLDDDEDYRNDVSEEVKRTTEQNKHIPFIEPQPETPKKKKHHPTLDFDEPVVRTLPDRVVITQLYGHQDDMQQAKRKPRLYMVACDFSAESLGAIEWTMGTMMRDRDEVHIVAVMPRDESSSDSKASPANQLQTASAALCDKARDILRHMLLFDIKMVVHAIRGNVKDVLMSMIVELPLTMVVCGSRGRSAMKGLMVGSVSTYLIQKSPVPVSVIRQPKKKSKVKKSKAAHAAPLSESVRTGQLVVDELGSKSKHQR